MITRTGAPLSLMEHLERARRARPAHACLIDENGAWTYDALARDAGRLAGALRDAGVGRQGRVAMLLPNSPAFALTYLAAAGAGAIPVPLDPLASGHTLRVVLADCEPRAMVCGAATVAHLAELAPIPSVRAVLSPDAEATGQDVWGMKVRAVAAALHERAPEPPCDAPDADAVATIVYTSGTTDVPKGVMLTHRNLDALIRSGFQTLGVGPDDRIGHILPLCHLYGLRELQIAIAAGATLVLSTQASFPASLLKWFGSQRITGFPGVPGHFSLFLGRYRERLAALGDHLRYVLLGTAPTSSALLADLRAVLPRTRIHKTYGLTECGRVTAGDFTDPGMPAQAVGPPAPGVELIVRDEGGRALPAGETGRVFISSDMVMKGYWGRPAENAELIADGWFTTRDLAYIDDRGLVVLVGRVDAMINTGGEKTAPWEVELVLRQHPAIVNAAVVAMPDEEGVLGQVPKAFVVARPGEPLGADEVRQHCARHLESYKVPRKIVFLPQLPETSLGKVQLHALEALAD